MRLIRWLKSIRIIKQEDKSEGWIKQEDKSEGWIKIENRSDGPQSWTEYTDHDGFVYIIYDVRINPGFSDSKIK